MEDKLKKQVIFIMSVITLTFLLAACNNTSSGSVKLRDNRDSLSYAIGFLYGRDILSTDYDFNMEMIFKGMSNAQNPDFATFTEEQLTSLIMSLQEQVTQKRTQQQESAKIINQSAGKLFMEENAKAEGVITTESGLQYKVIKAGNGKEVKPSDTVKTHYTGRFLNGEIFDSSHNYGEPAEFQVDMVIDGWSEGLALMREGDIFELYIPDSLAYGEEGYSVIEPGSYLIFEVELLEIVSK